MHRLIALVALAAVSRLAVAEDHRDRKEPIPQSERMLKGEDAKLAAEYEKKRDELAAAGKRDEALKATEELLALRRRLQGEDHWQTMDARLRAEDLRRPRRPEQARRLA